MSTPTGSHKTLARSTSIDGLRSVTFRTVRLEKGPQAVRIEKRRT
jgi:hypothetical protein